MRLLIINPGSTSTKISVFSDRECVFTESVFHDYPVILSFRTVNDQLDFRMEETERILSRHGLGFKDIDVFVGRGGCAYSQRSGVMEIDRRLYEDTRDDKGGSDHPAKLGVMMAYRLSEHFGKRAFTVDPTNVDELIPEARITGIKGVYKRAQCHVLNQKGIARLHSEKMGMKYEDSRYIVCHIDGGITICAHDRGRMIDGTEGAGGDGPFSPTRLGSIPAIELARYIRMNPDSDVLAMCSRSAGFVSHFGTSSADHVHELVEKNDEHACMVWSAMIYQIAKEIGAMAAVLEGRADAILLTGGLMRFQDIEEGIRKRCSWIAPIFVYRGEVEQEEMAYSALDAIEGRREIMKYTGEPVFRGFGWE